MKRIHLLFLILLGFASHLPAQDPRLADSLRQRVTSTTVHDTAYFDLQFKLAAALLYSDPGGEALSTTKAAMAVADSLGDDLRLGRATNLLANCYKGIGLNDRALLHYFKAMELFQKVGDQKWIANMHSNISIMYLNKGDEEMAMQEQQKALNQRKKIGYYKGISGVYNGLGNIYDVMKKHELALIHYQLALDSCGADCSPYDRATFLGNVGNAYGETKQYAKCRYFNRQALALHRQMGIGTDMSRDLHNIGESFLMEKAGDSAEYYLKSAYHMADSLHYVMVKAVSSDNLRSYYESTGKYQEALKWAEIAMHQYDTIHQEQLSTESRAQEMSYQVEQAEREDAFEEETALMQKDADLKRQRILNWSMALGLVLVGGFGFVVSKRYREKKQANEILEEKVAERTAALKQSNEQLVQEVEQKERASKTLNTFIYRSSHDLKGPLTSIKGLVDIAASEAGHSPYIDHIGAKASQLDGVLQQLIDKLEVDSRVPQNAEIDLPELWADLLQDLHNRNGAAEVSLDLQILGESKLVSDPLLLKMALRQLLFNAIDFRRKGASDNQCILRLTRGGTDWAIEVVDQGIGFGKGLLAAPFQMFQRGDNQSTGAGLGLYLAHEAALKMGVEMEVRPSQVGTAIVLTRRKAS